MEGGARALPLPAPAAVPCLAPGCQQAPSPAWLRWNSSWVALEFILSWRCSTTPPR
jgi:hypothetical protein